MQLQEEKTAFSIHDHSYGLLFSRWDEISSPEVSKNFSCSTSAPSLLHKHQCALKPKTSKEEPNTSEAHHLV